MYRFQISAFTQPGETIALVGSIPEMGSWDITRCVRLRTNGDRYPLWWVDLDLNADAFRESGDRSSGSQPVADPVEYAAEHQVEYKYVRLHPDGSVNWEFWGSNRWLPLEPEPLPSTLIVEDGWFGVGQPYPYGYFAEPMSKPLVSQSEQGLKIVVIGSSVALGCSAWLLKGWAWHLAQAVQQHYGHQLINVSQIGTNVTTTIARFPEVVVPEQPDIVIIALSLGNEGLASCPPQQRRAVQRHFEQGLQQLVSMVQAIGARPILGGVYPNGGYTPDHYGLLRETRHRMLTWGVPVLDWLAVLEDGKGRWKPGIYIDPAHPNTEGHRLMYEAIDLSLFEVTKATLTSDPQSPQPSKEIPIYQDNWGFHLFTHRTKNKVRIVNASQHTYTIAPDWQELQTALQKARLTAGIYVAHDAASPTTPAPLPCLSVQANGAIATTIQIPPATELDFHPTSHLFTPDRSEILFYNGYLGIFKEGDRHLHIINESDHDYNIHPMWKEVRVALKGMPSGVYEDVTHPDTPFRTLMIGKDGLESRVKAPPQSAMVLQYQCSLAERSRVAIIPLGDRCAVRMLLYKMEYDGPAFPFDLTRTTNLADVADMIQSGFHDMWNPALLHYNHDARRIYHTRWTGLSFAHEVEESDDPEQDMSPVHERMRVRYAARSERFWYTLKQCDKALFVRTGLCDRNTVIDLVHKLEMHCQGKPFRLLLISPQPSDQFADLAQVLHSNLEFNPDRMYDDVDHWLYCTEIMRGILDSLGVSSKNLFWCPPNPPKD